MSCFLHALHFFLIHQPLHFPSFSPHFFHSRNVSFHPSRGIFCSSHVLRVSLALPPDLSPLPVFCHRNPDISAVLKWASNLNVTRGLDRFPSTQSLKHTHTQTWLSKCRALSWVHWFTAASPQFVLPLDRTFFAALSPFLSLSGSLLPVLSFPSLKCPGISLSLSLPLYTTLCLFLQYDSISPFSEVCQFNLSVPLSAEFCFRSLCLSSSPSNLTNCFPIANSYITYSVALAHTHTLISWATLMLWILLSIIPAGWCRPWAVSHREQQY